MTEKRTNKRRKRKYRLSRIIITLSIALLLALAAVKLFSMNAKNAEGSSQTAAQQKSKMSSVSSTAVSSTSSNSNGSVSSSSRSSSTSTGGKWQTSKGNTYYTVAGKNVTGFQTISDKIYYFDPSTGAEVGQMQPMVGNYWQTPSMLIDYPDLSAVSNLSVQVSIADQRAYIKSGDSVIYVMYISSGTDSSTPTGSYAIQAERGDTFYNASEGEGANYWTSWLDHGVYLFHSVPIDQDGNYIVSEAVKLGKEPASHGCIRLSIADAKWINQSIPYGTPITIG